MLVKKNISGNVVRLKKIYPISIAYRLAGKYLKLFSNSIFDMKYMRIIFMQSRIMLRIIAKRTISFDT